MIAHPTSGLRPSLWAWAILLGALLATGCSATADVDITAQQPAAENAASADLDDEQIAQEEPTAIPESTPSPAEAVDDNEPEVDAESAEEPEPVPVDEPPVDEPEPASGVETIDWRGCGQGAECGTVDVPADYGDPDLGTIEISVSIHRAVDINERVGYLFVNPGGPGFAGIDMATSAGLIFTEEILESFDIVGFDPRGVASSEPPFACGDGDAQFQLLKQMDAIADTPEEVEIGNQAAQLCVDSMGPVGARLHSEFVARDMDEIRKALGADQISYLGFSYGSTLGGWYASLFPERVYSMAVDGASNPLSIEIEREAQIEELHNNLGPIHEQFSAALASCDDQCPIWNGGDPEGYWYDTIDKLSIVQDAADGDSDQVVLGLLGNLYTEATWPLLHEAIFALNEDDDPSKFLDAVVKPPGEDGASIVAHINCLDMWALYPELTLEVRVANALEISDELDAIAADEYPLLGLIDLDEQGDACDFYEAIDAPVFDGVFDGGGVPILVIGNVSDPFTSFIRSEEYANEVLADGRLVRVEHPSHVVYPANPCVNEYIHAALIEQVFPNEEVSCDIADAIGDVLLEPYELSSGATSVKPEGWRELSDGLFAKGDPTDQPVLLFQSHFGNTSFAVTGIEQLFGVSAEAGPELEFGGVSWEVYELEADGLAARFAVRPGDDGVLILGQSRPGDLEELTEKVLIPAIESFEPAG